MRTIFTGLFLLMLLVLSLSCAGGGDDSDDGGAIADDTTTGDDTTQGDDTAADDSTADDDSAPAPELAIPCVDTKDDVYVTPSGLQPFDEMQRGVVIRCATGETKSKEQVETILSGVPGVEAKSGYSAYRIAYRTERDPGVEGAGTAMLLVPDAPLPGPLPVIVGTHGTAGLADECAPSWHDVGIQMEGPEMLAAWAASGYPVVAPDYAGLGNEGTQGYHNTADTAHSVLDAARAAMNVLTPGSVDGRVIVEGHSQGGGAALAAQAFARTYGAPDLDVIAVVAYAAGYPTGRESGAFLLPSLPIDGGAGMTRTVLALSYYADFANLFGIESAADPFKPSIRDYVASAIETQCIFSLNATLYTATAEYTPPATFGDFVDPDFRQEMSDCIVLQDCSERAAAYMARSEPNAAPLDPQGARVLMIAGTDDTLATPMSQACLRDQLIDDGVTPDVCVYDGEDHFTIMSASAGYALDWAFNPDAPCPSSGALPDCEY